MIMEYDVLSQSLIFVAQGYPRVSHRLRICLLFLVNYSVHNFAFVVMFSTAMIIVCKV